jgi:hypothetical protein
MPYLRDLLELNENSWKAENLSAEMRGFISAHRHLATTPTAGFALFWLARNSLFFDNTHPSLIALHYADLIKHPQEALRVLGRHLDMTFDERYSDFPEHRDREKPLPDEIPPVLLEACEAMMSRLLQAAASMGD